MYYNKDCLNPVGKTVPKIRYRHWISLRYIHMQWGQPIRNPNKYAVHQM